MPQFDIGSTKTARAVMRNPTARPFNYKGVLYMGINQATMAETLFQLNAGESKEVLFAVTMPSVAGTYPVYIGVFSGDVLIPPLYQATENVTIVSLPFTFSNVWSQMVEMAHWAWNTIIFYCTITNPNDVRVTKPLYLMWYFCDAKGCTTPMVYWSFELSLAPGEKYNFKWDGNTYGQRVPDAYNGPQIGVGTTHYMWLRDAQGNESAKTSQSRK